MDPLNTKDYRSTNRMVKHPSNYRITVTRLAIATFGCESCNQKEFIINKKVRLSPDFSLIDTILIFLVRLNNRSFNFTLDMKYNYSTVYVGSNRYSFVK